jgi:hypothetical protein
VEAVRDSAAFAALLSSVLAAAIQRSLSRDVAVIQLANTDGTIRWLVAGRHAEPVVKEWLASGMSYGDVLTRLHRETRDQATSGAGRGES